MRSASVSILVLCLVAASAGQEEPAAPDFTLADVAGTKHRLRGLQGKKAIALIFTGIQCPRSTAAERRLCEMAAKYADQGVAFLTVNSNWNESSEAIAEHARKGGFSIPLLKDEEGRVAGLYNVDIQPTAILLDGRFRIRYRGLIDDHKLEEFVRNPYLEDAIRAVLEGRKVEISRTEPIGCFIKRKTEPSKSSEVTYAGQISRLINRHCVSCHRPGQVGPFSLESYEQARAWSREMAREAKWHRMPPWKPVTNVGEYYNERRLGDEEIELLKTWHEHGAPLGDPERLPEPPKFSDTWMLGTPDIVLKAEGGYEVAAKGPDEYRCYVLENPFEEDTWITGVEYRAGNSRVVHHVIAYLDVGGASVKLDAHDPRPGYKSSGAGPRFLPSGSLGGWAPGNMPRMLPKGVGRLLRKRERIVLETHYHRTGRPEKDEGTQVALYLAKEPVKQLFRYQAIANFMFRIPAGAEAHRVTAAWTVRRDVHVLDVMPHMHLLGREISMVATFPDGRRKDLVAIKDWDFNWQETYQFKEPLAIPEGTRIVLEAKYDNSTKNPNNPSDPPRDVRWGDETTDEMCIGFIGYVIDGEDRTKED